MFGIGSINWKNTAENLIITIVILLIGAFIGYKAARMAQNDVVEQLIPTIEKAIDKESIKNTIHNAIDLKIDKIKKSDSLNININQIPDNVQKPTNVIIKNQDSIPKKKRTWFGRLFKGKNSS